MRLWHAVGIGMGVESTMATNRKCSLCLGQAIRSVYWRYLEWPLCHLHTVNDVIACCAMSPALRR